MGKKVDDATKKLEAETLKQMFSRHGIENYAEFARRHRIPGGKSMVNQHREAMRPISLESGVAYARAFGCSLREISARLAMLIDTSSELSPSSDTNIPSAKAQSPDSSTQRGDAPDGAATPYLEQSLHVIPIYRLEAFMLNAFDESQREGTVPIPGVINSKAFAVRCEDDTLELATPSIAKGMIVVFDPDAPIRHQAIVLAGEPGTRPVIRQLICDGPDLYLSAPKSGIPPRKVSREAVIAVAVKAVLDL